jgi:hypothetical protein
VGVARGEFGALPAPIGAPARSRTAILASSVFALLIACDSGDSYLSRSPEQNKPTEFDRVLLESFEAEGRTIERASEEVLCARLYLDVLGYRPGRETILSQCTGRSLAEVASELLRSEDYRNAQRRRWVDRLRYSDALIDRGAIEDLEARIDAMYRGELGYRALAIETLSHPGFIGRFLAYGQEDSVAEAAFRAFLGRPATAPEAEDLGILWKAWRPRMYNAGDEAYSVAAQIDPFACEAGVRACVSTILGFAAVELPREGRVGLLAAGDLTEADWEALRAPGRLFAEQPMFWESAADEILTNYLGYKLGAQYPAARQALIDELVASNGDLVAAELTVLTSIVYAELGRPTKIMTPEAWLRSVAEFTGAPLGDCRSDPWFAGAAASMGGCPGHFDPNTQRISERVSVMGIEQAVAQDEAALTLCTDEAAVELQQNPDETRTEMIARILERAYGRAALEEEVRAVDTAAARCTDCTSGQVASDLCTAIAGSVEYAAY